MLLWNIDTGGRIRRFVGHNGAIRSVALSDDDKQGVSAGVDGTVRVWDIEGEREIQRFIGHEGTVQHAAFLPGHLVSAGVDGTVRVWDIVTGDEVRRYQALDNNGISTGIDTQMVDGTGTRALSGLRDGTLRLWNLLPTHAALLDWIAANRYIAPLSCTQRLRFGVDEDFARFGEQLLVTTSGQLRAQPAVDASGIAMLQADTIVRLLDISGNFYEVCTSDGLEGWVSSALVGN
jgi:hypothetical protein